jgi:5-methylcytosine-specific restriction endonuclease McrA
MIKVNITQNILRRHLDFAFNKSDGRERDTLIQKIDKALEKNKGGAYFPILAFIKENIKDLLIGNPQTLYSLSIKIERKINNLITPLYRDEIRTLLKDIFISEYNYFVDRKSVNKEAWCAYSYIRELDISVCPYCNTQFIFCYESEDGKGRTRPVLDHFFEKKNFPYLAISIQNLVPCCKVCNSDFKGQQNINYDEFLHPFEQGFENNAFFKKVLKPSGDNTDYFSTILGEGTDFELEIDYSLAPDNLKKKIKGNIDLFHLEHIYNAFHKSYVQEIILKSRIYNIVYRQQLLSAFNKLFNSIDELKQFLIPADENANKVILSKLTKDIIQREIDFDEVDTIIVNK